VTARRRGGGAAGAQPVPVVMLVDGIGPDAGGGERMAAGLATALPADRWEVTLCATRGSSPEARRPLEEAGVPVISLDRRGRLDLLAFGPLISFLRERQVQILHAHKFGSNVWGTAIGRALRVPVVIAQEQTWSYQGKRYRRLIDFLIGRAASAFIAVSTADRERMISVERVPPEKVVMIPNAYIPRPRSHGPDLRTELGFARGTPLIGTVAMMRRQKALHVLIQAFAEIGPSHPEAQLILGGDGPCRGELELLAEKTGLSSRIHFIGLQEHVGNVLEAIDIAAISSNFEGTPLFVLECMAHGAPLVATKVGGIPDLVDDRKTALLVPPRDPAALADALAGLLEDPAQRRKLSETARLRSAEFTIDRISERFAALYERLLAQHSAKRA
jgi:glycosyltransferase involved in cell wall biosynthesis